MENLYIFLYSFIGIGIFILIVGIVFSGCSVVRTDVSPNNYKEGMVYYYLPESLIKITSTAKVAVYYNESDSRLIDSNKLIEQKFVVTTENIADTDQLLSLKYKSNVLMHDHLKFQVNNNGLLKSLSVTTEDKTAAIIDELASAPQYILSGKESPVRAPETILKIKEYTSEFYCYPSDIKNADKKIDWNILIFNELGIDEVMTVDASFNIKIEHKDSSKFDFKTITIVKNNYVDGILTRPLMNTYLNISSKITGELEEFKLPVTIIDCSKLINIPIKRTAFVKRENTIIIEDGLITSNEITNPSSVKGFVSIPINIAKAIVSIPGQLVTFRYDNTVRLKNLEEQKILLETKILENDKFQLMRENEINKVIEEIKINELTRTNDINKLTIELQTQTFEAEKNRLQMLKQLEILKEELKELKSSKNEE